MTNKSGILKTKNSNLTRFGFNFDRCGTHNSRTIMLDEISLLLSHVNNPVSATNDYKKAIEDENCLGKRSAKTRALTYRHLKVLYSLDPSITVFRTMLYFWQRDVEGQPLLSLMCAYSRDSILRMCTPFILEFTEGDTVSRQSVEDFIDGKEPGRFSRATLTSTAQNINSSFTKTGHLTGRSQKVRSKATPTPGSVSYALLLGYLNGERGTALFKTEYAKILDCSFERAIELAQDASRRGWIVFKKVGNVIEVLFPNLINAQETEWVHEQS